MVVIKWDVLKSVAVPRGSDGYWGPNGQLSHSVRHNRSYMGKSTKDFM